jgi:hypothetical protein
MSIDNQPIILNETQVIQYQDILWPLADSFDDIDLSEATAPGVTLTTEDIDTFISEFIEAVTKLSALKLQIEIG